MAIERAGKLNQLQYLLPEGLLVDALWLQKHGYSDALRSQYVASGWLEQPARGVYCRPGTILKWESTVVSLQNLLGKHLAVGGRTALEFSGFTHYLKLSGPHQVHLYGDVKPPGWLGKLRIDTTFTFHNAARLFGESSIVLDMAQLTMDLHRQERSGDTETVGSLRRVSWGERSWPLVVSCPERAVLEMLDELPKKESFHQVDVLFESLVNLSPRRVQRLLEQCQSIKVKRLFLWFADRHRHAWRKHLDEMKVSLGSGKRKIVENGRLDLKYLITVPEDMYAGQR